MLNPNIKPFKSLIEGTGLAATNTVLKGTVVWKLDPKEKQLTLEELKLLPPEEQRLAYQYKDKYIIVTDTSEHMNHSCNPNTWWQDDETLTACRDIQPGEEVTYDYATAEIDPRFRSTWECNCGATDCRKVITGNDCLDKKFQKKYQGHLPSWVMEYIKTNIPT